MVARPASAFLVAAFLLSLLAGCTGPAPRAAPSGAPAGPTPGAKSETGAGSGITLKVPESIAQSPSPAAVTKAPSPVATVAAARVEPKGKLVYGWDTAVAPAWFDPQENPQLITPYGWQYALHDAVVKHLPGQFFAPSLAESYEIAPDQRGATFVLRPNLKFHDGTPVTSEDVKFTFENYRGANSKALKDRTDKIEIPDNRTIRFTFKEPFVDFPILYGTAASGAGWIVPAKYYQQVGPDGFKKAPIGAGPYKFIRQTSSDVIELEAFTDYWRKTPSVKTIVFKAIPDDTTRVAAMQTGEIDFMNLVNRQLLDVVKASPGLQLAPVPGAAYFFEFPGYERPENPFHDPRVRQAVSLALNRESLAEAQTGGFGKILGNWITTDYPGAIELPRPEENLAQAKQLLAEAGYPNGFDGGEITPFPPYTALAERAATQLLEVGIRLRVNAMPRAAFEDKRLAGRSGFTSGILINTWGTPGDAASQVRASSTCNGSASRVCEPDIERRMEAYDKSTDPKERERLVGEIQKYLVDNYIYVPSHGNVFTDVQGPRIANPWQEILGSIPQYFYLGPYEDVKLKD